MAAVQVSADAPGFYHPGRSGVLRQGPKAVLATFGELHPRVRAALGIPARRWRSRSSWTRCRSRSGGSAGCPTCPAFQPLRRDFAFLVDAAVPAETLLRAARNADKALVAEVALFDRYAASACRRAR
jgi:phenylalanyl-tRNA synthetase beta chain